MRTAADFLIRGEGDADFAVFDLRMGQQIGHSGHDLGDPGLVVRSKQCGAVCGNERMPLILSQLREAARGQDDIQLLVQHNVLAVIVLDNLRFDVGSGKVSCRIEVGQEADGRYVFVGIRGQCSHYIGMLIHRNLSHSEFLQFFDQLAGQLHLSGSGGASIALFIGLGVDLSVRYKPFNQFILQNRSSPVHLTV
ncbi:hypothetical protein D3C73_1022430 [compost metagenome]